jgi:hypothetical protein
LIAPRPMSANSSARRSSAEDKDGMDSASYMI